MDNDKNRPDRYKNNADLHRERTEHVEEREDSWDDLSSEDSSDHVRDFKARYEPEYENDDSEFQGKHAGEREPDREVRPGRNVPGFLKRIMHRGETGPSEEQLAQDARRELRERQGGYLFDEESDRHVAEESTRDVPAELLEREREVDSRAARRIQEADDRAARHVEGEKVRPERESITERERKSLQRRNRLIILLAVAAVAVLLFLTAPMIQSGIFRTEGDSLVFNNGKGLFGPRAAVVQILLGLLGGALLFMALTGSAGKAGSSRKKRGDDSRGRSGNLLRNIGLVLLLFIPLGIVSFFNFSEFRNNDLRFSSITDRDRSYSYSAVAIQDVVSSGDEVFYTLQTGDGRSARLNVSDLPAETVRLLDTKMPAGREVRFTSTAIDRMVELGIYTWEEAIQVFTPRNLP